MRILDRLAVVIGGNATQLEAVMARVGAKFAALGGSMQATGMKMSTRLTLPTLLAGGAITKLGVNFDDEMTKIETLVGVAGDQVDEWRVKIRALAPAVGKGPVELARAMFAVTSAGERGASALDILTRSAKASAVGLGDTKTVALAVTSAMRAYQREGLTAAQATDVLVATVREGNLEASELAGSLGRVIGIAAEAGVSFAEVGGAVATFTRLGVSAEEAVTGLRATLNLLFKTGKEGREALAKVGLSLDDVRQSVRERGLAATLVDLMDRFKGNQDLLAQFIPNVRALAFQLGVASAQGDDFVDITGNIRDSLGIMDEAFLRTARSPGQALRQLGALFQVIAIQLAKVVVPAVLKLGGVISRLLTAFSALNPAIQQGVVLALGFAAAVGPLLWILGGLVKMFGLVVSAMSPVGLAVAALAGIVLAIRNNWLGMGDAAARAWDTILEVADTVLSTLVSIAKPVMNALIGGWVFLGRVAVLVWDKYVKAPFKRAFDFIWDWGGKVLGAIGRGLALLGRLAADAASKIIGVFTEKVEDAAEAGDGLGSEIAQALLDSFGQDYVGGFVQLVRVGVDRARTLIGQAIAKLRELFAGAERFGEALAGLKAAADALEGLSLDWPAPDGGAGDGTDAYTEKLADTLKEGGREAGRALVRGLIEGAESMGDTLRRVMMRIAEDFVIMTLEKGLGIASPSRLTRRMGLETGLGFALGVRDSGGAISTAVSRAFALDPGRGAFRLGASEQFLPAVADRTVAGGRAVGGPNYQFSPRFEIYAMDSRDVGRALEENRGKVMEIMYRGFREMGD